MLENSEFNILVVDDEIFNIEVVLGFLEDEGYQLSYNTNPKKALQRIYTEKFDLILLDINMPELDGIELCKRIKNDPSTKEIPVIFLSAFSDTTTITNAFNNGAVDYITKPFNGLELIARVKTHIQIRKYIKELQVKQEKLAKIVATDMQTGLPNRLRFVTMIKKETQKIKESPSRLSLAYIKVDNLDKINSIYGYQGGDNTILKISKIVKSNIPKNFILARLFTSEFVLLMPNSSIETSKILLKKLLNLIRVEKNLNIKMSCSIGIGEYNLNEDNEIFIHRVEKLMQNVSRDGGNMIYDKHS